MSNNLATKDIKNLFHPATNLKVHEHGQPLILDRGDGIYVYDIEAINIWKVWLGYGAML